ncbi:MAG: arginine--tRNA ligase [Candidatus Paceibacterota bacterium]|jgi:arginyl-tRNA synthetase
MNKLILNRLNEIAGGLSIDPHSIRLDIPESVEHGDFSSNVAMVNAKKLGLSPKDLAEKIIIEFEKEMPEAIESVHIAGPGFINFRFKDDFLAKKVLESPQAKQDSVKEKVMVEYTDPNPFKVFHIGHLMSNAIGESISRLIGYSGKQIIRANWQGDVGPHVAKAIWGSLHLESKTDEMPEEYWGRAYVLGNVQSESDPVAKQEIDEINRKIYDRSDEKINEIYDKGRRQCLDAFEKIYARLGTKFDNYFFEGIEGRKGQAIVDEFREQGVFEESDGAIVFKGEKYGLHTRVFTTSKGLPTYETKELGLNREKFSLYPDLDQSIIITANEQSDYFRVLLKVMDLVYPEIATKTKHISHGMLRFASGKMSSRTGNVISAESLISEIKEMVIKKIADRDFSKSETDQISDEIAIGAIKYTILRSSIGGDIIFDSASSISFEGDSGPYLQYSAVRAASVLEKARSAEQKNSGEIVFPDKVGILERLIVCFSYTVERAQSELAPQIVANYLISLAGAFNAYYATQTIIDNNDPLSPYRLALVKAFRDTMEQGLFILGIKIPTKM